jgi:hypothetical protein
MPTLLFSKMLGRKLARYSMQLHKHKLSQAAQNTIALISKLTNVDCCMPSLSYSFLPFNYIIFSRVLRILEAEILPLGSLMIIFSTKSHIPEPLDFRSIIVKRNTDN